MGRPRAKVKRGFGEVGQLPSGRYRARYTGPDGSRHSAPITFVARIDAEAWLVEQERLISRGECGRRHVKPARRLFGWVSRPPWLRARSWRIVVDSADRRSGNRVGRPRSPASWPRTCGAACAVAGGLSDGAGDGGWERGEDDLAAEP